MTIRRFAGLAVATAIGLPRVEPTAPRLISLQPAPNRAMRTPASSRTGTVCHSRAIR